MKHESMNDQHNNTLVSHCVNTPVSFLTGTRVKNDTGVFESLCRFLSFVLATYIYIYVRRVRSAGYK